MSLFSSLDIGYSGLDISQVQMGTVSHNISNANTEGYTRQRVSTSAQTPLHTTPGDIGRGVGFDSVTRIHNEYVFARLKDSYTSLEYDKYSKDTLEEIARYFPDSDGIGLQNDMKEYFDSWNSFATNPTSSGEKVELAQQAQTFAENIKDTRSRIRAKQDAINDELKTSIDEINDIGSKIADINAKILNVESVEGNNANDLRDQRDKLEVELSKLLDFSVYKGSFTSDASIDSSLVESGGDYNINIAGESFVDGVSFHPLVLDNKGNKSSYYSIYHESEDGTRVDMGRRISGGKVGAILDMRGREIDSDTSYPTDGILQEYIDSLDAFAKGLIRKTDSVYASSAVKNMTSKILSLKNDDTLVLSDYGFKKGTLEVVMYDNDGNEVGRKSIEINDTTTINDGSDSSIVGQFNSSSDDNSDNNSTNDIDDYFTAYYSEDSGIFSIQPKSSNNYKIAIEDNGTDFAGITQVNGFFSGSDASDIDLKREFAEDPTAINAYKAPVDGDNETANDMIQIQYQTIDFIYPDGDTISDTPDGFYRGFTTQIAVNAENSGRDMETSEAIFNTVNQEQQSISGVNIDEELANLLKYQTAYSANAKVIATIDKMLESLLSIKQ